MIKWRGDQCTSGPLSQLKGCAYSAQLEGEQVAVVLLRYELDKSSLLRAITGHHVMVVDAITLTPSLPPQSRLRERTLLEAGLQNNLRELARCRNQRIEFEAQPALEQDVEQEVTI